MHAKIYTGDHAWTRELSERPWHTAGVGGVSLNDDATVSRAFVSSCLVLLRGCDLVQTMDYYLIIAYQVVTSDGLVVLLARRDLGCPSWGKWGSSAKISQIQSDELGNIR